MAKQALDPKTMIFSDTASQRGRVVSVTPHNSGMEHLSYGRIRLDSQLSRVDFKTDEVRSIAEMRETIEREQYAGQVQRYIDAITSQIGQRPHGRLIFLRVANMIQVEEL